MNVLAATPDYPPRSRVGAWLATHELLVGLVARGHHVDVITLHGRTFEPYTIDGVDVSPFYRGADLDAAVRTADVVVSHCGDNGVAARFAARRGVANVRLAHGVIVNPAALAGAALVVFNSNSLAASVECPSPWIVCRPPVHADRIRTTPGDMVTLVNLSESKGGELLWRLARNSKREFLAVRGGYGVQYDAGRLPNVEIVDMTENMRDDVYARTRVLLVPSERETWGMVAVEAFASGIPVIAHPTPGLVESLGRAGVFVDRADGQSWLDEIERLYDPDEWSAASLVALARSAELDPTPDLERFAAAVERVRRRVQCAL